MVEFGLALPILLLVMYGLIETGRLVFMYASVVSAARQAVRYGSVTGDNGFGTAYYNDCAGIRASAQRLGFLQPFQASDIQIGYDNGPGAATPWSQTSCPITDAGHPVKGDRVMVQVSAPFSPILPFFPFDSFPIVSAATRTLLGAVSVQVDNPGLFVSGNTGTLTIVKTADPTSYDTLGQLITYRYVVTNTGTGLVTNIHVGDDKAGAATCPGDTLAGASSFECQATYNITQADIDNGTLTNTATATGDVGHFAQAQLTMSFVPKPELLLAKLGDSPAVIARGAPMTYAFTLSNGGNVPLDSPFTIIDPNLDGPATCPTGTLDVGGAPITCTGVHTLSNNDISATYVNNTATATALYGSFLVTSAPVSAQTFVPELDLEVYAQPVTVAQLGQTITYTYSLENRTTKTMSNLRVNDARLGTFDCLASLAPGALNPNACTRTYSAYTQADMNSGTITSLVTATAQGGVVSDPDTSSVGVTQQIALTLTKTVTLPPGVVEPVPVGTVLTYGYSFKNDGNVDFTGPYTVADNKISPINCTAATGTLGPLQTKSCANFSYTVTQADYDAGSIVNRATVTAMIGGIPWKSPEVSKTVITFPDPRLALIKSATNPAFPTANPTYFTATGQTLTYTFTLKNTGGVELRAPYTVFDPKVPSVLNCPLAAATIPMGGSTSCSGNYLVTSGENSVEEVLNSATATASSDSGIISSTLPAAELTVKKFVCTSVRLKHAPPTPIESASSVTWTLINNTNLPVHIATITITWNVPGPNITQVTLGGATIWTGNSSLGGLIVGPVPSGGWLLPTGNTNMGLQFQSAATGIRIQLTFTEPGCQGVDSNVVYPD
jgi:hypothetical protein